MDGDSARQSCEDRRYGDVVLVERWMDLKEFIPILDGMAQSGVLALDGSSASIGGRANLGLWQREQMPSGIGVHAPPGYMYRANVNAKIAYAGHLLSHRWDYYRSIHDAITQWCGMEDWHGEGDGRSGEVGLFVPEQDARITSLVREGSRIVVAIEHVPTLGDLWLKGAFATPVLC